MTEAGVIPAPEDRQPRETGRMLDIDGIPVVFSINLDGTLRIRTEDQFGLLLNTACADLDRAGQEEFAHLFIAACWQAAEAVQDAPEDGDG